MSIAQTWPPRSASVDPQRRGAGCRQVIERAGWLRRSSAFQAFGKEVQPELGDLSSYHINLMLRPPVAIIGRPKRA